MKSITVSGGNLFEVAAKELSDATQWVRIAQLNQLVDPQISGVIELIIPPVNKSLGGGIGNQ